MDMMEIPQCAMPHPESCCRTLEKDALAGSNQNEWNSAIARLNSFCAAALQETGKLTSPSFSGPPLCGARASRAHAPDAPVRSTIASVHAISVAFFMFASIGKF